MGRLRSVNFQKHEVRMRVVHATPEVSRTFWVLARLRPFHFLCRGHSVAPLGFLSVSMLNPFGLVVRVRWCFVFAHACAWTFELGSQAEQEVYGNGCDHFPSRIGYQMILFESLRSF